MKTSALLPGTQMASLLALRAGPTVARCPAACGRWSQSPRLSRGVEGVREAAASSAEAVREGIQRFNKFGGGMGLRPELGRGGEIKENS